jgi:Undecaprenyl-phosphate glucose phosphotransferase
MAIVTDNSLLETSQDPDNDGRFRRGPFRPNKLVTARQRRSGDISVRFFRLADFIGLIFFTIISALQVAPDNILLLSLGQSLPFLTMTGLTLWLINGFELYRFNRLENLLSHFFKLFLVFWLAYAVGLGLSYLTPHADDLREAVNFWLGASITFFGLLHLLWWQMVKRWRDEGQLTPNIVIVGATKHAQKLIETALSSRNVSILGVFDDRLLRSPQDVIGVPVLGGISSLLGHKITPFVDQIVIAIDPSAKARVKSIIEKLRALPNEVSLLVDIETESARAEALSRMADLPLARVSGVSKDERRAFYKRIQDLVIGSLALLLLAPLMAIIAMLIKLDSPGPIFFRQKRHGFNNEEIWVWKFRSMYTHMTDHTAQQQVTKNDPRVTRIGRFIRKTSIDELPQLLNVLIGEMSLVGPRPHAIGMRTGPDESARLVAEYAWRHRMKPGITGWAAIKGSRGPMDRAEDVVKRIALDVEYIERQSFWLDLYIILMTIPCLLGDNKTVR